MTRTDAAARPAADTRLRVRTVAVDETAPLVPRLDPRRPLLWMRRGEGMIGLGEVLRIETRGPDRIADADDALAAAHPEQRIPRVEPRHERRRLVDRDGADAQLRIGGRRRRSIRSRHRISLRLGDHAATTSTPRQNATRSRISSAAADGSGWYQAAFGLRCPSTSTWK